MKCPLCRVLLSRSTYEGLNIHACEHCRGTLVSFDRLKAIEARRQKSEDDLINELVHAGEDTDRNLRCSRCLSTMEKKSRKIGHAQFSIDRCGKCKLIWLDAGELAKWQVVFQFSEKGEEAKRFQDRLKNMTPAEREKYDELIASLPEENIASDIAKELAAEFVTRSWFHFFF